VKRIAKCIVVASLGIVMVELTLSGWNSQSSSVQAQSEKTPERAIYPITINFLDIKANADSVCGDPIPGLDYERRARETNWAWPDRDPNLLESIISRSDPYQIELKHLKYDQFEVRVLAGNKFIHAFKAHRGTTFKICGSYLVYPEFNPGDTGGWITAYDLLKAKQLWKQELEAVGPISHARYYNRLVLDVIYGVVFVQGWESYGKYHEYLDLKTGRRIANRIFEKGWSK